MLQIIYTENLSQRAGVYYVRTQTMVRGFHISLEKEFDEGDTPETNYMLLLDGVLPVATCRLNLINEKEAKIERVCVLKEYQGKGLGRKLMEAAEKQLNESGIKRIIITSRDEAVGFYEALGYKADCSKVEKGGVFNTIYTEKTLV